MRLIVLVLLIAHWVFTHVGDPSGLALGFIFIFPYFEEKLFSLYIFRLNS